MRAVLDVNVLISALLSPQGAAAELLRRWLVGEFELVVSELLLAELDNALAYPELRSRIPAGEGGLFVAGLRRSAELVSDPQQAAPRSPDPGDDYLLALAETASAVLVSGDHHLLDLEGRLPVRSVRGFLDILEGELPSH